MNVTMIKNAKITDGSGQKSYLGYIVFSDSGEILYAGANDPLLTCDRIIDADGRAVTPGFIDIHRHFDTQPFKDTNYGEVMLRQGITTAVTGNCGISLTPAPVDPVQRQQMYDYYEPVLGHCDFSMPVTYTQYLESLQKTQLPVNTAAMIGTGAARIMTKGFSDQPLTEIEIISMRNIIEDSLKNGASGVSLGIMYLPECYGSVSEFSKILEPVGKFGKVITTHIRGEGDSLLTSIKEVAAIAEEAHCALEISHFKSCGKDNWNHTIHQAIDYIEHLRTKGMDVTCDFYPYDCGSTMLSTMCPPTFVQGNIESAIQKLGTKEGVAEFRASASKKYDDWDNYALSLGWDRIILTASESYPDLVGMNIEEAARKMHMQDAFELAAKILFEDHGRTAIINQSMSMQDVMTIASLPYSILISDAIYADTDTPHPRMYGAFPRFLRIRDSIPFETAIHKMTLLPAQRMQLKKRGLLKKGYYADINIFDPSSFTDRADYTHPLRMATGLDYCFVNGHCVIDDQQYTGMHAGILLR